MRVKWWRPGYELAKRGDDEGNKGTLALVRIEHVIYVAFVVLMFCVTPVVNVDVNTIKFNKERSAQCGVNIPLPEVGLCHAD